MSALCCPVDISSLVAFESIICFGICVGTFQYEGPRARSKHCNGISNRKKNFPKIECDSTLDSHCTCRQKVPPGGFLQGIIAVSVDASVP